MTSAGNALGYGRVLFVGAGPGNPELLTVRARDILEHTVHAWVDPAVPENVRSLIADAEPVSAAKLDAAEQEWQAENEAAKEAGSRRRPARPTHVTAAEIVLAVPGGDSVNAAATRTSVDLPDSPCGRAGATGPDLTVPDLTAQSLAADMVEIIHSGVNVVRLVAGNPVDDPAVLRELREVAALGAEFEVIPGMTGASALPAYNGIPTGDGYTAVDLRGGLPGVDWSAVAAAPKPLILTVAPTDLAPVARELKGHGVPGSTPATVTVHATTRKQRSWDVTLDTLKSVVAASGPLAKEGELPEHLVVTLGAAASGRSKYSWWESRALYGWNVLVPRAKAQAGPMSTRLASHGAIPIEVPTISMEPPRSPAQMERAVKGLVDGRYQWIVFTSVNAVNAVWEKLREFGLDARALAGVSVAAVGEKTAQAVRDLGITPELLPKAKARNAAGLVEVFPPYDEDLDPVDRVLLPRADIATDTLVDGLIDLGWSVEDVVAYRTVRAAPPSQDIRDMIKSGGFDAVCFTSSSTVKNLVGIAGKPHTRTIIACIGPMAAKTAEEHGLRVDVMPEVAGVPELVDALAEHVAALRAADQLPPPRKRRRRRRTVPAE
ncbi:uroporphyrinogen-III synthase [Corynebacterium variabile]|uniref:Uroporphyrinogen-III synthase n=14 Tax=Corynebacterium variabile TaxID=1727 RepID=A0A0X2NNV3_9CORY|nr:uroporphyrinogen-III synthase [Corynebacterium variabile]AEK38077.1 uroporphyrin-III C-methyltransferase / uroporphyrinogen-III synthase [Corynebacterium variabile DSM 44702]GEC86474.1 uroporphyrinogen-III synthase [Corynebacterium variabile]CUU67172.1 Uroporphyrinogen-III synthase [Corynebacterium variabile]